MAYMERLWEEQCLQHRSSVLLLPQGSRIKILYIDLIKLVLDVTWIHAGPTFINLGGFV